MKNILSGPRSNQYGTIKQHFLTFTSWRLKTSNYINDEKPSWNHTHPSFFNVLWQVHSICQSKFTIECRIMFPLSSYSIWSFPCGHPVAAYFLFPSSRPFFLSLYFFYLSIKKMIYRAVTPQDVTNICSLPFIVSRMSLSSLSLRNIFFLYLLHDRSKWTSASFPQNHVSKYSFQKTPSVHHILNQLSTVCIFTICSSYIY